METEWNGWEGFHLVHLVQVFSFWWVLFFVDDRNSLCADCSMRFHSFFSSRNLNLSMFFICFFFFCQPLSLTVDSGLMSIVGQAAIASTVLFTSLSSTALLATIGHPYVITLHELFPSKPAVEGSDKVSRRFKASKMTVLGNKKVCVVLFFVCT